jgi:hypothetical protein
MRQEVNGLGQTFLLKNKNTPAKKLRLSFCHLKRWLRKKLASKKLLRSITNSHVQESPGA